METPHVGAPKTLRMMDKGFALGRLPVAPRLPRVVQSWQSLYELLPVDPSVGWPRSKPDSPARRPRPGADEHISDGGVVWHRTRQTTADRRAARCHHYCRRADESAA